MNIDSIMYETDGIKNTFGDNWCGPDVLPRATPTLVAVYEPEEDGKRVEVFAEGFPAVFYTLRVDGFDFWTESGQDEFAHMVATAFANGMLVVDEETPATREFYDSSNE